MWDDDEDDSVVKISSTESLFATLKINLHEYIQAYNRMLLTLRTAPCPIAKIH